VAPENTTTYVVQEGEHLSQIARRYGMSWNVLAQVAYWSSGQILMVLVPIFLGLQATAVIAAVVNLFRPLNPLMQSMTNLMLPAFSSLAKSEDDKATLMIQLRRFLLLCPGSILLYGMLMTAFANPILHYVYGGRYDGHMLLVFLCALIYTGSMVVQVLTVILKVTENIRLVVYVWLVSAVLTTLFSVPMMRHGGVAAALFVAVFSYFIAALFAWKLVKPLRS